MISKCAQCQMFKRRETDRQLSPAHLQRLANHSLATYLAFTNQKDVIKRFNTLFRVQQLSLQLISDFYKAPTINKLLQTRVISKLQEIKELLQIKQNILVLQRCFDLQILFSRCRETRLFGTHHRKKHISFFIYSLSGREMQTLVDF